MLFVLVHSPLVGPLTWAPVAAELRRLGFSALVPELADAGESAGPYWQQHAVAAARSVAQPVKPEGYVLVGHSGAGPLLPAIREAIDASPAAYLFVDAGLPTYGQGRLDFERKDDSALADELYTHLQAGGRFPEWTEADLAGIVPDPQQRQRLIADLRPRPLQFFVEPIPVLAGWPDAPCGYLQFSPAYDRPAAQARGAGWAYRSLPAGHFHLLVDPPAVAQALLSLLAAMHVRVWPAAAE